MAKRGKMIDLELDDEASMDAYMPMAMPQKPRYPYGLHICLTGDELKKLSLDIPRIGDTIELRAFAEVTCTNNEHGVRVELQIQKMAVENEDEETDSAAEEKAEAEAEPAEGEGKRLALKRAGLRAPIGD